jgi:predicted tellurium resistance membrane protein TerC
VMLVAEAFHQEIPKGYIYYSLAFSLVVEGLNLRAKKKKKEAGGGSEDV